MNSSPEMDVIRDSFREAAMGNIPHIANAPSTSSMATFDPKRIIERGEGEDGYCAGQWLVTNNLLSACVDQKVDACPLCGTTVHTNGSCSGVPIKNIAHLIVHYNNDHRMTWLDLANKL